MNDSVLEAVPSGAANALEGYFYQLRVSVLVALNEVLARRMAHEVELEPATQEDLELQVEEEPGALAEHLNFDGYHLIIQCKLKTTGPRKIDALTRLLTAGGPKRISAAERLQRRTSAMS